MLKPRCYIKNLKWLVPVELIDYKHKYVAVDLSDGEGDPFEYDFNEVELAWATNRKDKNGKEVYENDIVKVRWRKDETIGVVKFKNYGFYIMNMPRHSSIPVSSSSVEFEVIGNIYENPELLIG